MLYLEYEQFKARYLKAQSKLNEILTEKEVLFGRTQLQAVDYGKDKVSGGNQSNAFEAYVIEKEKARIDERLAEVKSILDDREKLLKLKLEELKQSKVIEDKIYRMRFIERQKVFRIAKAVSYSDRQVIRILQRISEEIKTCH